MLSDGATGSAALRCCCAEPLGQVLVEVEVLCSVFQRESVGQFLAGRVTAGGKCDGIRPRVFWKGM